MNIFAPDYYKEFQCIADKCKHNCCIGWEIDIDNNTLEYYRSVKGNFGTRLKESITTEKETSFFRLSHDERCPFLNKNNLCDIILNLGEDKLCQICTDHPRFRNYFDSHTEIGLGLACEEASRLILTRTQKTKIINTITNETQKDIPDDSAFFLTRTHIFNILQNRNDTIEDRIKNLINHYNIYIPNKNLSEWADFYLTLEVLDADWHEKLKTLKNITITKCDLFATPPWQNAFEQLLIYFVYRHLSDSVYDNSFNERLAFCVLSYKIIYSLCIAHEALHGNITIDTLIDISRQYSSEIEYSEENINSILDELF